MDHTKFIHRLFDKSPVPNESTIDGFFDEANLIFEWLKTLITQKQIEKTAKDNITDRTRDKLFQLSEESTGAQKKLGRFDVIKPDMIHLIMRSMSKIGVDASPLSASLL